MMKKMNTPTSPSTHWLPLSHTNGSRASLPSAIRNECENITDSAATSRSASKLLARPAVRDCGIEAARTRRRRVGGLKGITAMTDDILIRQARPGDGPALEEAVE